MLCNVTPGNWGGADSTSSKPALVMEGATRLFLVHPHLASSLCDEEASVRIINWCTACTKRENMPLLCKIDKSSDQAPPGGGVQAVFDVRPFKCTRSQQMKNLEADFLEGMHQILVASRFLWWWGF